ncbi:uncharacterized protein LOC116025719 [Ipomoea triloba]|uniref:uncharacterized protein LOC116025719 n=1 Tax=Ipomoea triloba TaxID=35885 RepID=UPI00125DF7FA|nr:uncharacterized protein LOC116025719 [Ipomoea triloba]
MLEEGGDKNLKEIKREEGSAPGDGGNECQPFTIEEIKAALFSMAPEKSPGPDGFGAVVRDHLGVFVAAKSDRLRCVRDPLFHSLRRRWQSRKLCHGLRTLATIIFYLKLIV